VRGGRFALAACLAALAGACGTSASRPRAEDEVAAIEAVLARQCEAWNRGDIEGFMALGYWRSEELSFYSGGSANKGYDGVLARYIARYKAGDAETGQLTFSEVRVDLLGPDAALARGRWRVDFQSKDDAGGLYTLVLERKPEGWRIVHDHTSSDD
jgi:beta-aspartyl-peptidase (threonine type)